MLEEPVTTSSIVHKYHDRQGESVNTNDTENRIQSKERLLSKKNIKQILSLLIVHIVNDQNSTKAVRGLLASYK